MSTIARNGYGVSLETDNLSLRNFTTGFAVLLVFHVLPSYRKVRKGFAKNASRMQSSVAAWFEILCTFSVFSVPPW